MDQRRAGTGRGMAVAYVDGDVVARRDPPAEPSADLVIAVGAFEHRVLPPRSKRGGGAAASGTGRRSEEHTSELQSLMRISYAVFCLKQKTTTVSTTTTKRPNQRSRARQSILYTRHDNW